MPTTTLPAPDLDTLLAPLSGESRPLREWLTTFHFVTVALDPFTNESSWILDTAARVLGQFSGAAVRANFLVTCSPDEARTFLGPLAAEFLVFADPARAAVRALGLSELPAFILLRSDGTVPAAAQGWDAPSWKDVAAEVASLTHWSQPTLPAPGDPGAFRGTPALV